MRSTVGHRQVLAEMRAESGASDAGFAMFVTELPERDEIGDVTAWQDERRDYRAKYRGDVGRVFAQLAREVG